MTLDPYIERQPGDLLTAEDWNDLQKRIQDDVRSVAAEAAAGITRVQNADNADQLDGHDLDALTAEVTRRVMEAVAAASGYRRIFRILGLEDWSVIEHALGRQPMVEVFQLEYFQVVCQEDEEPSIRWVTFYLSHSSERRLQVRQGNRNVPVELQPTKGPPYRIPFAELLETYAVSYTNTSSLGDLETEFWKAFFAAPNQEFPSIQFCHSPWFERCCREERTVADLKRRGDWNDLQFSMRPVRTINLRPTENEAQHPPRPSNVAVTHFDNNTLGLRLELPAVLPPPTVVAGLRETVSKTPQELQSELKVMVILCC